MKRLNAVLFNVRVPLHRVRKFLVRDAGGREPARVSGADRRSKHVEGKLTHYRAAAEEPEKRRCSVDELGCRLTGRSAG